MSRPRRLGVTAALVDGEMLAGDVSLADGSIESVGLPVGDAARGVAVAGFVDLQVNGFAGVQFIDADSHEMSRAARALGRVGVVFASPTLYSSTVDRYSRASGVPCGSWWSVTWPSRSPSPFCAPGRPRCNPSAQ